MKYKALRPLGSLHLMIKFTRAEDFAYKLATQTITKNEIHQLRDYLDSHLEFLTDLVLTSTDKQEADTILKKIKYYEVVRKQLSEYIFRHARSLMSEKSTIGQAKLTRLRRDIKNPPRPQKL